MATQIIQLGYNNPAVTVFAYLTSNMLKEDLGCSQPVLVPGDEVHFTQGYGHSSLSSATTVHFRQVGENLWHVWDEDQVADEFAALHTTEIYKYFTGDW